MHAQSDHEADLQAAIAIHRTGGIDEAEATYRRVLGEQPDHPEALHMLGVVHLQRGRLADALSRFQSAIAQNGTDARYHNNLGNALMGLGNREEAIAAFQRAVDLDPDFLTALCNLGTAQFEAQRFSEAAAAYSAVLDRDPANHAALTNFGALLLKRNRVADALAHLRRGLEHHPDDAGLLCNLAFALERINELPEAEDAARRALAANPGAAEARFLLARLDNRAGRLDQALSGLNTLLADPGGRDLQIDVWFELGKVHDRMDAPDEAYAAWREANRLQAESDAGRQADGEQFLARVAANRAAFTRQRLQAAAATSREPDRRPPVFFVGFPRSGTTLMESVLAAHRDVVTTGERSPLEPLVKRLWGATDYAAAIDDLTDSQLSRGRRRFWFEADRLHGSIGRKRLVDKMPMNIVDLGYAGMLFPDAHAVVALRDPRDACLSCFMQRFTMNNAMRNFLDLGDTVRAYVAVMDLWLHYRETLPIPWLEYRYEDFVDDFDGTVQRVLQFIGLDWHHSIDGYRDNARNMAIVTPSYRDVTSPVHGRAVGRWRRYRAYFEPYLDDLEPFVSAFGYPAE